MKTHIEESTDEQMTRVLYRLFSLFAISALEKHLPTLYAGGYARGPDLATFTQEAVLKLCEEVKSDAVALIDAIAPPDFILKSVLGQSDGQVLQNGYAISFFKSDVYKMYCLYISVRIFFRCTSIWRKLW